MNNVISIERGKRIRYDRALAESARVVDELPELSTANVLFKAMAMEKQKVLARTIREQR